ncbi:hypothetical protein ACFOY8_13305 [Thalassospira xianhensis]|uniref:Uncharacterized protein n=1 Tax=Thalassospira xianhensis MCCC 1A02616 TaxID=1177929 RepID=A0A367UHN8_9PROT|nr:hypothetical protein [Thalassospira xianhensis]RCK07827.1 hypothetical protein TH5_01985 [Thalassospira xianhensis MCCC 1A02616]
MLQNSNLKVGIESQVRCAGSCGGCVLTLEERREGAGGLDVFVVDGIKRFVASLVDRFETETGGTHRVLSDDKAAFHFGQGDHLMMDEDKLRDYVRITSETGRGTARGLISTSLIGKPRHIVEKLAAIQDEADKLNQAMSMLLVFDPARIMDRKLQALYDQNLDAVLGRFLVDEPILNIPPNIAETTSQHEVASFLSRHKFDQVEAALFPTIEKAAEYAAQWPDTIRWLTGLIEEGARTGSFTVRLGYAVATLRRETDELDGQGMLEYLTKKMSEAAYIDSFGKIYPALPLGIADVTPLSARHGFQPVGSVFDADLATAEGWANAVRRVARRTFISFQTEQQCSNCPHRNACAAAGFSIYKQVMRGKDIATSDCPIGVREMLDVACEVAN